MNAVTVAIVAVCVVQTGLFLVWGRMAWKVAASEREGHLQSLRLAIESLNLVLKCSVTLAKQSDSQNTLDRQREYIERTLAELVRLVQGMAASHARAAQPPPQARPSSPVPAPTSTPQATPSQPLQGYGSELEGLEHIDIISVLGGLDRTIGAIEGTRRGSAGFEVRRLTLVGDIRRDELGEVLTRLNCDPHDIDKASKTTDTRFVIDLGADFATGQSSMIPLPTIDRTGWSVDLVPRWLGPTRPRFEFDRARSPGLIKIRINMAG